MRESRKFCQRSSDSDFFFFFFFFVRGEKIQIALKVGIIGLPFKGRFAGGPMMANIECWLGSFVIFQGIRTSIAKKPYIFFYLSGWFRTPCSPPPPLDSRIHNNCCLLSYLLMKFDSLYSKQYGPRSDCSIGSVCSEFISVASKK